MRIVLKMWTGEGRERAKKYIVDMWEEWENLGKREGGIFPSGGEKKKTGFLMVPPVMIMKGHLCHIYKKTRHWIPTNDYVRRDDYGKLLKM